MVEFVTGVMRLDCLLCASPPSIDTRIRATVKATVEFDGMLYPAASSAPTALWITANPAPPGELPLPTDVTYEHFSPDLGVSVFSWVLPSSQIGR